MHTIFEYFYQCFNLRTLCLFIGFAVGWLVGVFDGWMMVRRLRKQFERRATSHGRRL